MYVRKSTCFMMTYALHVVNISRFFTAGVNIPLFTIYIIFDLANSFSENSRVWWCLVISYYITLSNLAHVLVTFV